MSIDTDKRKLRGIWEDIQGTQNNIDSVTLIQNKKESQVTLSAPVNTVFNNFFVYNSDWVGLTPRAIQPSSLGSDYENRAVSFIIEKKLPEIWVPFARVNVEFRRAGDENIFDKSEISLIQFVQVVDLITSPTLKLVKWNFGFVQKKVQTLNDSPYIWYDYEMRINFLLLNPNYITAS